MEPVGVRAAPVTGRTVFLTYVFPPDESPRAVQIGRLVRHSGLDDLHVVCAIDGAAGAGVHVVPWGQLARLRRDVRWRTIRSRLMAPDAFRPWVRDAAHAAARLRPRVLVTFGQPMSDHLAGLRLTRGRGRTRWIAHLSDPWVDNPFRREDAIGRAVNRRLEARVVRGADRLVFTSQATVDLVMAKYPPPLRAKASVIPHAFDPEAFGAVPARRVGEPLVVRHLGAFYGARSARPLLAALGRLAARRPGTLDGVRVELIGPSETPVQTLPEYAALPAGLVSVSERVAYADSLTLMRSADLLVAIDAPARRSVFLPSKLVDYLGARRPLLALTPPGTASDLVARAGGWVAAPEDDEAAAAALAAALEGARANDRTDWGDPAVRAAYTPAAVAGTMDRLVAEIAAEA
jgi:hypothetical protein